MVIKHKLAKMKPADALSNAISDLQDLGNECREAVDNTPESLQSTQRCESLTEAADALEDLDEIEIPEGWDELFTEEVSYIEVLPRSVRQPLSRAIRRDNSVAMLDSVAHVAETLLENADEDADMDDISTFAQAIRDMIDTVESLDFPGFRG